MPQPNVRLWPMRCQANKECALQIQAERNLLQAALADAAVQRLVLLSESCIPLYAAQVVWAQLMVSPVSRIHACANMSDPEEARRMMAFRQATSVGINVLHCVHVVCSACSMDAELGCTQD